MKPFLNFVPFLILIIAITASTFAQETVTETAEIQVNATHQTVTGFGASLAYYENWLTAHPKKAEIYNIIFAELSLDILRVRTAYNYDAGMIGRVKEFVNAAENSLGRPIEIIATSWSPSGDLKSNNSHKGEGGTLEYTVNDGVVQFNYSGFAKWWDEALDEYNANGIYPSYISIQNEPDWPAEYESCRLDPEETITSQDTIAGYNKSLDAVYDKIEARSDKPKIIGPETIGIGYNAVEKYVKKLDENKLDAISHHLYHGVSETNPFASTDFTKVGNLHPEIPHFQTEFYRGDWFALGGLVYKSFHDENVAAYLYWDLTWGESKGLVTLENPWSSGSWTDPAKGYIINKEFYAFKQFSAYIHPGWQRIETIISGDDGKGMTFISPDKDSVAFVLVNRSDTNELEISLSIPGHSIDTSKIYITSNEKDCEFSGGLTNSALLIPPHSIVTVAMDISEELAGISVEQINLSTENESIDQWSETIQISASISPANATIKFLNWEITAGDTLASVTQLGYLTAMGTGDGSVTVRASARDGSGIYTDINIALANQVRVESISLSATLETIDQRYDSTSITASILPANASNKDLTWEITKGDDIARLDASGWLYSLGTGDGIVHVKVAASDGSGTSKLIGFVLENQVPPDSIQIESTVYLINTYQGTLQLSAFVFPVNASNQEITWSINGGATLASIDQTGLLQALGGENGMVNIRVFFDEDDGISDEVEIELKRQIVGIEGDKKTGFKAWADAQNIHYVLPEEPYISTITLYTLLGKTLYVGELRSVTSRGTISMDQYDSNIYLLEMNSGEKRALLKVAYMK